MESRCRYTRINGARCSMPALNGHELCFQHLERKRQAQRKPVPSDPKATGPLVNLVHMDDHASVLANLNAIAEAFVYGLIDHRQLSALTRLMQTCLKTLHQKQEHNWHEKPDAHLFDVTYDEDGLALAVEPPPAPAPAPGAKRKRPRYADIGSGIGLGTRLDISAGAALEPARVTPDLTAYPAPETPIPADRNPAVSVPPPHQQLSTFQTLTPKPQAKTPVIKHLPQRPKTSPLFSNTYLPPEDVFASLPVPIRKLVLSLL